MSSPLLFCYHNIFVLLTDSKVVSTPAVNFEKHTTANQLDSAEFSQGLLPNSSKESNYKVIGNGSDNLHICFIFER